MRQKVLIMVDWFDPGFMAGGTIQSCVNLVKGLHKEIEFYILTTNKDLGCSEPYPNILSNQWLDYNSYGKVYYADEQTLTIRKIDQLIKEIAPHFLYLSSMFSLKFTLFPLILCKTQQINADLVLAPCGMLHEGALKFKFPKKKFFLKVLKLLRVVNNVKFHATDLQEENDIQKWFGKRDIITVPCFPNMSNPKRQHLPKKIDALQMIYISRVTPKKNISFIIQILKDIPSGLNISLHIYGQADDNEYLNYCNSLLVNLPSNVIVKFLGPLSNDLVLDKLSCYHLFVLPTLGENFGYAIYEALLAGRPVLISDKTPWQNLESQKLGFDIPLDNPLKYKDAIISAAGWDTNQFNDWSTACYNFAITFRDDIGIKKYYLNMFGQ